MLFLRYFIYGFANYLMTFGHLEKHLKVLDKTNVSLINYYHLLDGSTFPDSVVILSRCFRVTIYSSSQSTLVLSCLSLTMSTLGSCVKRYAIFFMMYCFRFIICTQELISLSFLLLILNILVLMFSFHSSGAFLSASEDRTRTLEFVEEKIARATMIPRSHGEAGFPLLVILSCYTMPLILSQRRLEIAKHYNLDY